MKIVLLICLPLISLGQNLDTIHIYFDVGRSILNKPSKQHLDSLAYYDMIPIDIKYGIIGYADYVGSEESNSKLSEKRAEAVQCYLLRLGIERQQITTVVGAGEIHREHKTPGGYTEDRKVDIIKGGFTITMPTQQKKKTVLSIKKINISTLKKNDVFELDNLFFLPGKSVILEESYPSLKFVSTLLHKYPGIKIQIEGHVHCGGNNNKQTVYIDANGDTSMVSMGTSRRMANHAYKLSTERAKSVYRYMIENGISHNRLKYIGLSCKGMKEHPDNNRRVEIRILEK